MGGVAGSSMLGSAGIVQGAPSHFPTELDAKVGEVARVFAVGAYYLAVWTALCGEGRQRWLKALFFVMLYEVFFLMYGMEDHLRVKRSTGADYLNCGLQLGKKFTKTIGEEH